MHCNTKGTARTPSALGYAPVTMEASDQELIARVSGREEAALSTLYQRYYWLVYSIAQQITADRWVAEEVIQDVFLAVWRSASSFRADGDLAAWLSGIVRHRAIDATRARGYRARSREHSLDDGPEVPAHGASDDASAWVLRDALHRALAVLPPAQRQVIVLVYYSGLTLVEAATLLDTPVGTVKWRLWQGLRRMRLALGTIEE